MTPAREPSALMTTLLGGVAHSFSHLFVLLYATVVLALEHEWRMGYDELFALSIPMTVMYGLAALPAGWLADRWSAAGMLSVGFFGTAMAALFTGMADTPVQLAIGLALIGTFSAIYHPVGIPWLVANVVNRGRAFGINGVFGSVGTAAAGLVAGLCTSAFGWRSAFIVPALVAMAAGVLFVIAWKRGWIRDGMKDLAPQPVPERADAVRVFIVMSGTMLCTGLIYQVTAYSMPKIFDERLSAFFGDSLIGIGGMVTLVYAFSAIAQIIGGELADRFPLRFVYMGAQFAQLPVIAAAFVLQSPLLVVAAGLMVSFNLGGQSAENSLLARYTPAKWRGRAYGAKFVLTLGVSALGVAAIPLVYRLTGTLDALFIGLFAFALLSGLLTLALPREEKSDAQTRVRAEPSPAE